MKSTNNNVQNTSQLALHQQTENLLSSRRNIYFTVNACLEKIGGMFSFEHMSFWLDYLSSIPNTQCCIPF